MRRWLFIAVLAGLVLAGCGSDDASEAVLTDAGAAPSDYFQAMEAWSLDVISRMDAVRQGKPPNDDPQQYAEYHQRRTDAELKLRSELATIEPAPETADAHAKLLTGFQAAIDLNGRIIAALQDASSANAVLTGPLSADIEIVGGGLLVACGELLDIARKSEIPVTLFC